MIGRIMLGGIMRTSNAGWINLTSYDRLDYDR